jgi:hypothetical protein
MLWINWGFKTYSYSWAKNPPKKMSNKLIYEDPVGDDV